MREDQLATIPIVRRVLVAPEIFDDMFVRTSTGQRLSCDWGEPDAEGFYAPTFTVDLTTTSISDISEAVEFYIGHVGRLRKGGPEAKLRLRALLSKF
jgi:hypothetical protein